MWRRAAYVLGGLMLLVASVMLLETLFPGTGELPPIRPTLARVNERSILIDGGMIDQISVHFGEETPIEEVDEVYRCLERGLEEAFGDGSEAQGGSRWARRLEVGKRLRDIQDRCLE